MVVQHGECSKDFVTSSYSDSDHTRGSEDLVVWVTVEPHCVVYLKPT